MIAQSNFNGEMPKPTYLHLETRKNHRTGEPMYYYRPCKKTPRIRIRGTFGSDEFKRNYIKAVKAYDYGVFTTNTKENTQTLSWLARQFKKSGKWETVAKSTQKQWDSFLYQMVTKSGNSPYKSIKKRDIVAGMDARRKTPAAANNFLKTCRAFFEWAKDADYIKINPTDGVKKLTYKSDGHLPWDEKDIENFRNCWDIGTRERLAMELMLDTGLRRGDVVRLGKQHIKEGEGQIASEKTGTVIYLTLSDYVQFVISQSPTGDLAYICTTKGAPRNKEAFGNWFRKSCRKAGVAKSAHGLRRTAASEMAYLSATTKELMATFGWETERMAEKYTKEADRKRLQKQAAIKKKNASETPHVFPVGERVEND